MASLARRWSLLAAIFVAAFGLAAWYFAGVFATPGTPDPAGTQAVGEEDWGRVLGAAVVVGLMATGILGVLIRLARPEEG